MESGSPVTTVSPASQTLQGEYGKPILIADAKACVQAAVARAEEIGTPMCIAITDPSGVLIYFERMDRAIAAGALVAPEKAKCAALYQRSTKAFEDALNGTGGARFLALSGVIPVEGGLPLVLNNEIVGAIGVSGGTGAQDGIVAAAGATACGTRMPPTTGNVLKSR
jgi:glc operon protein GlcG